MKKLLVLTAIIATVLIATAAAADFHPGGNDDSCVLCQVNHLPLAEISNTPLVPECPPVPWWDYEGQTCRNLDISFNLATGRAPPFIT